MCESEDGESYAISKTFQSLVCLWKKNVTMIHNNELCNETAAEVTPEEVNTHTRWGGKDEKEGWAAEAMIVSL